MNKLSKFLVIGSLMLCLTGCGFSVGKSANLGTGTVATNNFTTNNHQTIGSSSVESKNKGYASFDISKDGNVQMTTFGFQLPEGYTIESPAGIVDKTTNHVISYLVVYDSDKNCVAEIFDGKLKDTWTSDTDLALKEITSILKDAKITLNTEGVNSTDLIYGNLYALYVDNVAGEDKALNFFANQDNSDYAFMLYDLEKDPYIVELIMGNLQSAYLTDVVDNVVTPDNRFDDVEDTTTVTNDTTDVTVDDDIVTSTNEDTSIPSEFENSSLTNNTVSTKTQSLLASLNSDFNKINWGVIYSPFDDEGVVISVAPYIEDGKYPYLIIGITNLYNEDITFSAKGYAKGLDGSNIGTVSCYESGIGSGSTVIKSVYCENIPSGEIHWDNIELPKCFDEYAYWESDWSLVTDTEGYFVVDYTIDSKVNMQPNKVQFMLLDEQGNIIRYSEDYNIEKGTQVQGSINLYKKDFDVTPVDGAMFVNPYVQK